MVQGEAANLVRDIPLLLSNVPLTNRLGFCKLPRPLDDLVCGLSISLPSRRRVPRRRAKRGLPEALERRLQR